MKKSILLLPTLILISLFAKAQSGDKVAISLGPEFNIPFNTGTTPYGKTTDYYKDGYGGSIKIEVPIVHSLHFTGSAGFLYYRSAYYFSLFYFDNMLAPTAAYNEQGNKIYSAAYKYIPLKAGLQYYYSKCLYLGADAGEAIKVGPVSAKSFIYSGGLGGVIPINKHNGIDLSIRFERGYKNVDYNYAMSQFGFRLAYRFGW